jgi:hypothetical protein
MKYILTSLGFLLLFSGCAVTKVAHSGSDVINKENVQYFESKECNYLVGPFMIGKEKTVDEAVENTIKKANEFGLYGNTITNLKIEEGGWSLIFVSELCLHIEGNIEYDPNKL